MRDSHEITCIDGPVQGRVERRPGHAFDAPLEILIVVGPVATAWRLRYARYGAADTPERIAYRFVGDEGDDRP